ncbi:SCP2 domain-containing protein [Parashewanella curva]|uniref:Ubiquinone biosynthesis accessory factor UbiT n=1 Tax=Parashewanella curva TaxID=2338552 RepID=A0A3L8PY74_9GAMM|nr:SCP2 sterol-binding domain-containing protein [Parashewanella curva]RLV59583.1 SCP2 domain-containing protein [Parashewanella curva]
MLSKLPSSVAQQLLIRIPQVGKQAHALIPFSIKQKMIKEVLSHLLKEQMEDEVLEFLEGKWVAIKVTDFNFNFDVSFDGQWLLRQPQQADVTFSANSDALIDVAAGKEDPDTLFFQRQLTIEGDTELGLEVKNLLLSIEMDEQPALMRNGVTYLSSFVNQLKAKVS